MANAWCFDIATNTLGDLESIEQQYLNKLEEVHAQITDEEWAAIVEPMNLKDYESVKQFISKPAAATSGAWWDLEDPNAWETQKTYITNFDISQEVGRLQELIAIQRSLQSFVVWEPEQLEAMDNALSDGWKSQTYNEFKDKINLIYSFSCRRYRSRSRSSRGA